MILYSKIIHNRNTIYVILIHIAYYHLQEYVNYLLVRIHINMNINSNTCK